MVLVLPFGTARLAVCQDISVLSVYVFAKAMAYCLHTRDDSAQGQSSCDTNMHILYQTSVPLRRTLSVSLICFLVPEIVGRELHPPPATPFSCQKQAGVGAEEWWRGLVGVD